MNKKITFTDKESFLKINSPYVLSAPEINEIKKVINNISNKIDLKLKLSDFFKYLSIYIPQNIQNNSDLSIIFGNDEVFTNSIEIKLSTHSSRFLYFDNVSGTYKSFNKILINSNDAGKLLLFKLENLIPSDYYYVKYNFNNENTKILSYYNIDKNNAELEKIGINYFAPHELPKVSIAKLKVDLDKDVINFSNVTHTWHFISGSTMSIESYKNNELIYGVYGMADSNGDFTFIQGDRTQTFTFELASPDQTDEFDYETESFTYSNQWTTLENYFEKLNNGWHNYSPTNQDIFNIGEPIGDMGESEFSKAGEFVTGFYNNQEVSNKGIIDAKIYAAWQHGGDNNDPMYNVNGDYNYSLIDEDSNYQHLGISGSNYKTLNISANDFYYSCDDLDIEHLKASINLSADYNNYEITSGITYTSNMSIDNIEISPSSAQEFVTVNNGTIIIGDKCPVNQIQITFSSGNKNPVIKTIDIIR